MACLHCMVLFLRGPQKRSGLIRYGSGKDIDKINKSRSCKYYAIKLYLSIKSADVNNMVFMLNVEIMANFGVLSTVMLFS